MTQRRIKVSLFLRISYFLRAERLAVRRIKLEFTFNKARRSSANSAMKFVAETCTERVLETGERKKKEEEKKKERNDNGRLNAGKRGWCVTENWRGSSHGTHLVFIVEFPNRNARRIITIIQGGGGSRWRKGS